MTFDPSGGTASETDIILSRILPQERFRKPLSVNNLQAQFKTLPCKVKAIYQQHPESQPDSRARAHRRWTDEQWKSVMWSDESTFQIVFGNHGRRVLQAKEEKDHPDCYQLKVQKPTPVMVWRCSARGIMGNLYICATYAAIHTTSGTSLFILARRCQATFCTCYNSVAS